MADFDWPRAGWPRKGDKVMFLSANGYDDQLEKARKLFAAGQILTVRNCDIGDWSSAYEFDELPGQWFNTVMFKWPLSEPPNRALEAGSAVDGGEPFVGMDEGTRASPPPPGHEWVKSTLGHGEQMCAHCGVTNREAAVFGELDAPCPNRPADEARAGGER